MMHGIQVLVRVALMLFCATAARSETNVTSTVLDSAGGRAAGGSLAVVSAVGQPGGVQIMTGNDRALYPGFLNTFVVRPGLDTDGDGLVDELDGDNDNDGLADTAEVSGSAHGYVTSSDPNAADTDEDGTPDAEEAFAGTDPGNDAEQLKITGVLRDGSGVQITWQARGGKSYGIYAADAPDSAPTRLGDVSAEGGVGPWAVVTTNFSDMGAGSQDETLYRVVVE
jgi:hypothetical protein